MSKRRSSAGASLNALIFQAQAPKILELCVFRYSRKILYLLYVPYAWLSTLHLLSRYPVRSFLAYDVSPRGTFENSPAFFAHREPGSVC